MGRRADEVVVAHAVVVEAAAAAVRARVEEESEVLASEAKVSKADKAKETMRREAALVCRAALHAAAAVALAALCRMRAEGTLPQCKAAARRISTSSNSRSKAASNNSSTNSSNSSSIRMRDLRWVEGAEGAAEV